MRKVAWEAVSIPGDAHFASPSGGSTLGTFDNDILQYLLSKGASIHPPCDYGMPEDLIWPERSEDDA